MDPSSLAKLAREGHNLLITGFPGTGKTTSIDQIVNDLIIDGKDVRVTASTGNAAIVLKSKLGNNITVTTVHRLLGLMDGRFTNEKLLERVMELDNLEKTKKSIIKIDVLIIDEISLISAKLFSQIEFLLRRVRNSNRVFGGVQIILSGDFYQLPPVPSPEYGDDGSFVFVSPLVQHFHHINLQKMHRQDEPDLVSAIQGIVRGELSLESKQLFARLGGSLPPASEGEETLKLFATNFGSDLHNTRCLNNMTGDDIVYHSADEGDSNIMLRGVKELHLKEGCPVILIVNLTDELVNGLRGIVEKLNSEDVHVFFPSLNRTEIISKFVFTKYSAVLKTDVGSRTQIPLKLAFSLTAHKAQGMTIDRVIVDCTSMNRYGQLTVALSRTRKKKGLRVHNFSPKLVKKPPDSLTQFYSSEPVPVKVDLTCCCRATIVEGGNAGQSVKYVDATAVGAIVESDKECVDSDCDEVGLIDAVESFEKATKSRTIRHPLPDKLDISSIITGLKYDCAETDGQIQENTAVGFLLKNMEDTKEFVQYLWDELLDVKEKFMKCGQKLENKHLTDFLSTS